MKEQIYNRNKNRMDLKEKFKIDLHSGKEIFGMIRNNGYYLGEENDNLQTVLFDNGNLYYLKDGEIVNFIDGNDEFFIDKQIIKVINDLINLNPLLSKNHIYSESNYDNTIEFCTQNKNDEKKANSSLIKIHINRESKRIDISNILIPFELQHNGFGKKIINEIYSITTKHKYKLHLVQMVESFYTKMLLRGAKVISELDIVEITQNTKLN
ncbi:hypothetical protein LIT13_10765 [Flavobacterium psychrophilum]|uniref:hypothetical protein n=2 Tax=Flavobacterium psychrophilum TaxID=96345 RepID=UPI000B8E9C47|nr:hypothetical protein [Flavobacterium psychrophilum]EKT4502350.1 hypothetical protein [Flavobacterium psychrophilum]MCB5984081.1 hypothetical protein [Flavobacterium psychrophilum]MCB5995496.1 hypothetical protein [Flavobacterium psychrophilum]MCB6005398.1 hypothetical protein [Flavobacterium psychrophilum]MCB6007819.1 hypothetical protein [Flavobacterium psychrophilum]